MRSQPLLNCGKRSVHRSLATFAVKFPYNPCLGERNLLRGHCVLINEASPAFDFAAQKSLLLIGRNHQGATAVTLDACHILGITYHIQQQPTQGCNQDSPSKRVAPLSLTVGTCGSCGARLGADTASAFRRPASIYFSEAERLSNMTSMRPAIMSGCAEAAPL